jgi:serine/threonine protein phosphatase PrpC
MIVIGEKYLEPTRVLGDQYFSGVISSDPEIVETAVSSQDRFLILATDGFWNKVENSSKRRKIEHAFMEATDVQDAHQKLLNLLRRWELFDNTTH